MRRITLPAPTVMVLLLLHTNTTLGQQTTAELVELAAPAVVEITVSTPNGLKVGSGFIVDPDGVILTNHHVISGGTSAAVRLPSGDVFDEVQILAEDERRDIAILKVAGFGLPSLRLGNSDSIPVGSDIVAIGSPLGLENTVSTGIVSAFRQDEGYRLMQISAPISHGSSGGPILDRSGVVVGIAVSGFEEGQNLNFAVPVNYARGLLASAGNAPAARLAKLSSPESGDRSSFLSPVNAGLPKVTEFRDFAYEYEDDRVNDFKAKGTIHCRRIQLPGDPEQLIEYTNEEVVEYKGEQASSKTQRFVASLADLRPIEFYMTSTWWDGSRWKSGNRELHFEDGRVRGFTVEDGVRTDHDISIPPGTRASLMLTVASIVADSIMGSTVAVTLFDPQALAVGETFIGFKGRGKMKEAGREFSVVKTELTRGPFRAENHYSTEGPPYLVRSEYSGNISKIKKILP